MLTIITQVKRPSWKETQPTPSFDAMRSFGKQKVAELGLKDVRFEAAKDGFYIVASGDEKLAHVITTKGSAADRCGKCR